MVVLLPLMVMVGSEPVLMFSSEVKFRVMTSFTIANAVLFELFEIIVTVEKAGACLSKVTLPSASFTVAVACAPSLFAKSEKSTVNGIVPL